MMFLMQCDFRIELLWADDMWHNWRNQVLSFLSSRDKEEKERKKVWVLDYCRKL